MKQFQNARRSIARNNNTTSHDFESRADLINWARDHELPRFPGEMDATKMYVVQMVFDIWDEFREPGGEYTLALPLISKQCVSWILQLVELGHAWALHGDGKHKLHIGKWILMTFGCHCLLWDKDVKSYRHSFRPLIYVFAKQHESVQSVRVGMVALQMVATRFTGMHASSHMRTHMCTYVYILILTLARPVCLKGERLKSAVNISDCSNGLRSGMQYFNIKHGGDIETAEATPHCSDWAHIVTHLKMGRLLSKSNPYYGDVYYLLLAIHLAHSTEMKEMLEQVCVHPFARIGTHARASTHIRMHSRALERIGARSRASTHTTSIRIHMHLCASTQAVCEWLEYEEQHGHEQNGKYTTKELREQHLTPPWNTFSIGTYDGWTAGCNDHPLILPSNQCQESWHRVIMRLLKGKLRGSTEFVLNTSLPRLLLDDTINMPSTLCFEPVNLNVSRFKPKIKYEREMSRSHQTPTVSR